ncbi:MAG: dUTP diphosphatase [Treponema sp.]|jgi:dUTP pyrophosphatase|nr:dUTP diphosphatase [Treponema sp.]
MQQNPVVRIVKKDPSLPLPRYETAGASGMDLRAFLAKDVEIPPKGRACLPTGLFFEIPRGYEAQVRPRSGIAAKYGVTVLNSPGTIDSDYRGELRILLINLGEETFRVRNGDRIAQLVICPVSRLPVEEGAVLAETERGSGGFGSTGI